MRSRGDLAIYSQRAVDQLRIGTEFVAPIRRIAAAQIEPAVVALCCAAALLYRGMKNRKLYSWLRFVTPVTGSGGWIMILAVLAGPSVRLMR